MKKLFMLSLIVLASAVGHAADEVKASVTKDAAAKEAATATVVTPATVRTLEVGESVELNILNPNGGKAHTLVTCLSSTDFAKSALESDKSGGVMLVSGANITMKSDVAADAASKDAKNNLIQIICNK